MKTSSDIDLPLLRSLYASSSVARSALDTFATRSNKSAETTVERLLALVAETNSSVKRQDVVEFFKQLQKTNCGKFVIGRRTSPSRFLWDVSLVDVGLAAQGKRSGAELSGPLAVGQVEESEELTFTHSFQLRLNQRVEFRLPNDLSPSEAARLADFVKTLPIEKS